MYIFDAHGDAQTFDEEMKNLNSKKYEKDMIAMMMETFVLLRKMTQDTFDASNVNSEIIERY